MSPVPGEVWPVDLGLAAKNSSSCNRVPPGSESAESLVLYVPLTTPSRGSPDEVVLPKLSFLDRESVANVQGLGSIPQVRLERRLGVLPVETMTNVKRALAFALDFGE